MKRKNSVSSENIPGRWLKDVSLPHQRGMGSINSPTHTQKDCVESDLNALFAQFTVFNTHTNCCCR
eukprot:1144736-Pelagomonas_calceolata.AAC.3